MNAPSPVPYRQINIHRFRITAKFSASIDGCLDFFLRLSGIQLAIRNLPPNPFNLDDDSAKLFDFSLTNFRHLFQSRMAELVKSVRVSSDGNSDVFSTNLSIVDESIFNVNKVGDWFNRPVQHVKSACGSPMRTMGKSATLAL